MAKTQKYDEGLLMKALLDYAGIHKGKIKATELAKWANTNIPGLEDVKGYHFLRKGREKDLKSGQTLEVTRPVTERLNALNEERQLKAVVELNPLLRSTDLDAFFTYSRVEQRQMILNTRTQFEKLMAHNSYLADQNVYLKKENTTLMERQTVIEERLDRLAAEIEQFKKKQKGMLVAVDEYMRTKALSDIGIIDKDFDFNRFIESMQVGLNDVFSIAKSIQSFNSGGELETTVSCERRSSLQKKTGLSMLSEGIEWDDEN